jgi:hypothetical protein
VNVRANTVVGFNSASTGCTGSAVFRHKSHSLAGQFEPPTLATLTAGRAALCPTMPRARSDLITNVSRYISCPCRRPRHVPARPYTPSVAPMWVPQKRQEFSQLVHFRPAVRGGTRTSGKRQNARPIPLLTRRAEAFRMWFRINMFLDYESIRKETRNTQRATPTGPTPDRPSRSIARN